MTRQDIILELMDSITKLDDAGLNYMNDFIKALSKSGYMAGSERKEKEHDLKGVQDCQRTDRAYLYRQNKTMQMLGHCNASVILGEASQSFDELQEAYKGRAEKNFIIVDAFNLGYIWGKRAERKRKANRIS